MDIGEEEAMSDERDKALLFDRFLRGGVAPQAGIRPDSVDPVELARGIEVEHEHSPDDGVCQKIALDHFAESGQHYYVALDLMERLLKRGALGRVLKLIRDEGVPVKVDDLVARFRFVKSA